MPTSSPSPNDRPAAIADWRVVKPNWWYQAVHDGQVEVHLRADADRGWVIEQMCGTEHIALKTYSGDLEDAAVKAAQILNDLACSPLS